MFVSCLLLSPQYAAGTSEWCLRTWTPSCHNALSLSNARNPTSPRSKSIKIYVLVLVVNLPKYLTRYLQNVLPLVLQPFVKCSTIEIWLLLQSLTHYLNLCSPRLLKIVRELSSANFAVVVSVVESKWIWVEEKVHLLALEGSFMSFLSLLATRCLSNLPLVSGSSMS